MVRYCAVTSPGLDAAHSKQVLGTVPWISRHTTGGPSGGTSAVGPGNGKRAKNSTARSAAQELAASLASAGRAWMPSSLVLDAFHGRNCSCQRVCRCWFCFSNRCLGRDNAESQGNVTLPVDFGQARNK
ncbi:hypothetical protein BT67DRAFT_77020 [Trichocladium antarcticum]|uniref:Uncharacterized protein n=1 Tax=Trichocladium antarcticum TaxID=1450529 RepID=A0AAN6UGZ8_9PEZI|nr:hypothetical protein BT67DRAFT_77020 [Trichocladium antarcticum]